MVMACSDRSSASQSGLTIPYRDLRSLSGSHWCFWFGGVEAYRSLPRSRILISRAFGSFGLVRWPFTIAYHPADLGQTFPHAAFTNCYHRGDGTHIDIHIVASIGHQVAGWASVVATWAVW
jgi:hypothetical protein